MSTEAITRSRENLVLKEVDAIIRKPVDQNGCRQLLNLARETDISYIQLLISTAEKYLAPAFFVWHKYDRRIGCNVSLLMNTLYSKIMHNKVDHLRVEFDRLKEKYQRATNRRVQLLEEAQIKTYQTDTRLRNYIAEFEKAKGEPERERRVMLVQLDQNQQAAPTVIAVNKDLGVNYLETRIGVLKDLYYKARMSNQKPKVKAAEAKLVQRLDERPSLSRDCLNCISFVYEDEDLDFPMCRQPVTYFGRILTISNMQREILQQIVSYLNGRGGVLLIGTQRAGNRVVPIVEEVAEFHKEQQENRIQSSLANIMPTITLNKQVELAFIPIAENCRKDSESTQPVWKGNGACILRITVTPTEPHKTYYYAVPASPVQLDPSAQAAQPAQTTAAFNIFRRHTELGDKEFKDEEIYEFMKARYREYDPSTRPQDFVLRDRGNYHPSLIAHIDRCRPPEKGAPFYGDKSYYEDTSKKRDNELRSVNPLLSGIDTFKNITLLVVVGTLTDRISQILTMEEKLEHKITPAFKEENFRLSNNTFLLFHNCKFEKLKTGLSKQKVQLKTQNDKKQVILISTLPILSLKDSELTKPIQKELEERVLEVAKEKLEFKLIDSVWYIKCLSTITAVYIYFYLQHRHSLRGKFEKIPQGSTAKSKQFKGNPKNIKMPLEKRQKQQPFDKPYSNSNGAYKHSRYDKNRANSEDDQEYSDSQRYDEKDEYDDYEFEKPSSPRKRNYGAKKEEVQHYQEEYSNNAATSSEYPPNEEYGYLASKESQALVGSYQYDQYQDYQRLPVEERVPLLLYSQYDVNGNRYDYYDNSVVYMIGLNGQFAGCQYYHMQPMHLE